MVSKKKLDEQLKRINFHSSGWGRSEVDELCNILMPDEEIEECVNGYYEAGFALLTATKNRLLLIDKKPLGYLTVEDMRFDMINEFDLHKRLFGAQIKVSAGNKTLHFTSMNQVRLRRLLNYVQARMTQIKKDQEDHQRNQKQHLEEMNEQLRLYLMAAHKQQYLQQASAISSGETYGEPIPAQQPSPMQPASLPFVQESTKPASPFEEAALAAFDRQSPRSMNRRDEQVMYQRSDGDEEVPQSNNRSMAHVATTVPRYTASSADNKEDQGNLTPQEIGLAAARRVIPIISAYTRLPLMSQRRRYMPVARSGSSRPA